MKQRVEGPARHVGRRLHGLPRRDDRQHRLPGHRGVVPRHVARRALLDPQRLQHRLRGAARAGGPARGPARPAADVLRRRLDLPRRLRRRAGWRRRSRCSWPRASSRPRARRSSSRPRWRCCCPEFPLEQRATATALWGATGGVAAATGPALGGVLVAATSWRWVFFVNLAIGLPALIPARRLLRESRDPNPGPLPDIARRSCCSSRGVGLLSLGIVKGQDWGWGSARVVGLARRLRARARRPSSCARRATRRPVIELGLFRVRSFAVANAGVFLFALGFYARAAGQHPLPHRRVGLVDAAGRHRGHARAADGGALGRRRRAA